MNAAIYPGSFDPMTLGHLDIIKRASKMFDELTVSVLDNKAKNALFSVEERVSILREATRNLPNVTVDSFNGLLPLNAAISFTLEELRYAYSRLVVRNTVSSSPPDSIRFVWAVCSSYSKSVIARSPRTEMWTFFCLA